jgi:CMP-N,N'-diacetyllegionaminic acid synthase
MIAIIPARGGSKGLPGKNIKSLNSMPLICYTIKAALSAVGVSRVVVSTDDKNIAYIARKCGADVPFLRPDRLSKDNSIAIDAYLFTIDKIAKEQQKKIHSFVVLLPTSPLRTSEDIDGAIEIFNKYKADSVVSVNEAEHPPEWYLNVDKNKKLVNYLPVSNAVKNRQEFKKLYIPNGAVYIFNTELLREERLYYFNNTYPYIMPRERSVDIDDLLDFEWAEFLINKNK